MNIRKTIITATVALTMVAMIAPMTAGATTASDLQAQINALMAQLQQLQGTSSMTGSMPAACVGVTFSRNLHVGSVGADVKCFQALMNTHGYVLASSGAGSPGNETTYFGSRTLGAVQKLQAAQGWAIATQVGPLTRGLFNSWLTGSTGSTGTGTGTGTTVTPQGSGLWVALAASSPASGTIVDGQALAHMVDLTFTNGDNTTAQVTKLVLNRTGVSADATLANIYLFQGANRITDAASVSQSTITFNASNGIFSVAPNTSTTISVYSDLASGHAGETVGVSLISAANVTTSASSVQGSFPQVGNQMLVASAVLAGVTLASSTTPTTATINPVNDSVVWENLTVIGTRQVWLKWLRLREIGSVNYTDLQNFRLYVDGVMVGNAVPNLDSNGYVTFDLTSAPLSMNTGTRDIKVLGDVVGGSNRNFSFSLRVASDLNVVDSQYGANILATVNSGGFPATAGTESVASGTVTVQKATDSPSGDIVNTASNALLGSFVFTASGEPVKIDTLRAAVECPSVTNNTGLRNGALYANGVQIGSTATLNCATNGAPTTEQYTSYSMGSSLIVNPLSPVTVEIHADIYATGSTALVAGTDTLTALLNAGATGNGQGQISQQTITVPSGIITANALSVKSGTLTLSKYTAYTNQTIVPPVTNFMLAHFTLTAATTEAINLSSIVVSESFTGLTNLHVMYGTANTITTANPSTSTTYSVNAQLAAGATEDVEVFGDLDSTALGIGVASVEVTGTTVSSGTAVQTNNNAVLAGQNITGSTGSLNAVVDGSTPISAAVSGGQSVTAGRWRFTASNDNYTITEAKFTVHNNNGAVVSSASLWDGSTLLSTQPYDSSNNRIYFTGLSVPVTANTTKILTVSLSLVTPYTDGTVVTTGKNVALTLSYIKTLNGTGVMHDAGTGASNTTSTLTIAGTTGGTSAANNVFVFRTIPTFTIGTVTTPNGNLTASTTAPLYNFTVAADAKGNVALRQLKFTVTQVDNNSGAGSDSVDTFKFFRGSTDLTQASVVTIENSSGQDLTGTTYGVSGTGATVIVTFYPEEVIPAGSSYTYTLKGTGHGFTCSQGSCDAVATQLGLPTDTKEAGGSVAADDASNMYLASSGHTNTGIQSLASTANQTSGTATDVTWSDGSAQAHDYTDSTSTSGDWFNGYLQLNLPLDSLGVTAQ